MSFDPSRFSSTSVVDTCSVWSMLSSKRLFQAAILAKRHFCVTPSVLYECLQKPRSAITEEQAELMSRLRHAQSTGVFQVQACSLEDLLTVSAAAPGRLGSGEMSCLAVAYSIRSIAFMTEERLAKKYATKKLGLNVESTPRLYGYLHYHRHLGDSDHTNVIAEHENFERRPLTEFFNKAYDEAMRCRMMDQVASMASAPSVTP
ncbi:hypothetical protein BW686_09440 [Pseudomonas syringae]|uniref:PIN domain-containing protein n=1 Tax=Pseudomonas syringae TaxID=317 RepID=A0A244ETF4_PSESX|nr:hypothetical protein [Pseudomonas syringae]OUM07805.1 hypothetical protein BW686_09440 [Pseudomonas syringae]